MANFKVNGITPAFGNIKYEGENVKKIYSGSTLVWPVDNAPIIDETLWEIEGTATINGSSTFLSSGFNSYVFEAGDTFSAIATATDVEDDPTDLTWSLVSQSSVEGSGQTTVPAWVTGFVNPDGTLTISSPGGVADGNYVFYIKVEDTDGNTDHQIVSISGIVPTVNSYFKIIFDSSGSMDSTLPRLERDLLGEGIADPYSDDTCLRYYLQDFYATGSTEAEGNIDTATNGSDEFDKKVIIINANKERPHEYLANKTRFNSSSIDGFDTGPDGAFPNADSVVMAVFMDEASSIGVGDSRNPDAQYPDDGYAISRGIDDVNYLKDVINDLKSSKGDGFYRGLFYPVKMNGQTVDESALQQYYIASVDNTVQFTGNNLNEHGHLLASTNVELLDDGNTTNGYYTKRVVNNLRSLGYSIKAYEGPN